MTNDFFTFFWRLSSYEKLNALTLFIAPPISLKNVIFAV